MKKENLLRLTFTGGLLAAVILCGVIGYLNRPTPPSATATAEAGGLDYCKQDAAGLCVISFGQDSAGNMLAVLKNTGEPASLDLRISAGGQKESYPCQKVEFSIDTYYCLGRGFSDGSQVSVEVYSRETHSTLARGNLTLDFEATPVVLATATRASTATPRVSATPRAAGQTATPQAYPNPGGYPNPTSYPNPTPYP